jgi:hypothetical protein
MAFYDNGQWPAGPGQAQRQPSWEQPPPPSRSGMAREKDQTLDRRAYMLIGTSSTGAREEPNAFFHQLNGVLLIQVLWTDIGGYPKQFVG